MGSFNLTNAFGEALLVGGTDLQNRAAAMQRQEDEARAADRARQAQEAQLAREMTLAKFKQGLKWQDQDRQAAIDKANRKPEKARILGYDENGGPIYEGQYEPGMKVYGGQLSRKDGDAASGDKMLGYDENGAPVYESTYEEGMTIYEKRASRDKGEDEILGYDESGGPVRESEYKSGMKLYKDALGREKVSTGDPERTELEKRKLYTEARKNFLADILRPDENDFVQADEYAARVSGFNPNVIDLPKGNGRKITEKVARQFYKAAGKDKAKAMRMAEEYGWKN